MSFLLLKLSSVSFSYPLCILITTIIFYRYLDDISSENRELKSKAERQAINTVIQGSAAELMKLAMLKRANRIILLSKEILLI